MRYLVVLLGFRPLIFLAVRSALFILQVTICCNCGCDIFNGYEIEYDVNDDDECVLRRELISFDYETWLIRDRNLDGPSDHNGAEVERVDEVEHAQALAEIR